MSIRRPTLCLVAFVSLAGVLAPLRGQDPEPQDVKFFQDSVWPILEGRCIKCHGDGPRIKGGLRLVHRSFLLQGGNAGPVVDLESPEESRLLRMISYDDEQHQMPPSGKLPKEEIATLTEWVRRGAPWSSGPPPEVAEVEVEDHGRGDGMEGWSYRPLTRPSVPPVADRAWVRNPVDAFVLAGLEREGLRPAARADRSAWLRRATYDLVGLPPTPEEMDRFLADDRPDARERVIDDLLSRPQYGEKWGRHWLDLVRYAETNGYERDSDKDHVWRYRDYVIDAFNADKPYDRFMQEQIAGDELEDATAETIIATGYYRLMLWDDEPGQGALQARYDVLDDTVRTTGETFLGMTIGCARCHDHKRDPISQEDYYRFMAVFHGVTDMSKDRCFTSILTPEEAEVRRAQLDAKRADESRLLAGIKDLEETFLRRIRDVQVAAGSDVEELRYRFYRDTWKELPDFDALKPESEGSLPSGLFDLAPATRKESIGFVFEGRLVVKDDGAYVFRIRTRERPRLVVGGVDVIEASTLRTRGVWVGRIDLRRGTVPIRLDIWNGKEESGLEVSWAREMPPYRYTVQDPGAGWEGSLFENEGSWTEGQPGFGRRGTPGTEVVTPWHQREIWLRGRFSWDGARAAEDLALVAHHDDDVTVYINGVRAAHRTGYTVDYRLLDITPEARAALRTGENVIAIHCKQDFGGQYIHVTPIHAGDVGRASLRDLAFHRRWLSLSGSGSAMDLVKEMERRGQEVLGVEDSQRWRTLREELDAVRKRPVLERLALAVQESGPVPAPLHVHIRGSAHVKGAAVQPGLPRCLDADMEVPEPAASARTSGRRLAFARWLSRRDNPLPARVMMNRVWQHHFGRGIVRSAGDFGELGERPTHPDLLDWLASEFVAQGFSLKAMHRVMMQSEAYAMGTDDNPDAAERDPANDRFWRFDRRRLTAEELRDSMLAVAGHLDLRAGGPPFYSAMPKEVLATSSRPDEVWGRSSDEERRRRSIYIKVKRSLLTPILSNFDMADTDMSCPVRFNTTQPTQALHLLNGEFTRLQARALARRLEREAGSEPSDQVRLALRLMGNPAPGPDEVESHVGFLEELRQDYGLQPGEALEAFGLVVFNLNAFVYLD